MYMSHIVPPPPTRFSTLWCYAHNRIIHSCLYNHTDNIGRQNQCLSHIFYTHPIIHSSHNTPHNHISQSANYHHCLRTCTHSCHAPDNIKPISIYCATSSNATHVQHSTDKTLDTIYTLHFSFAPHYLTNASPVCTAYKLQSLQRHQIYCAV